MDVPVHLQHILMHKLAYEHTRYRCNDIYEHMDKPSYECAMYVREMAQAAKKRFAFGIWMISPKSFDEEQPGGGLPAARPGDPDVGGHHAPGRGDRAHHDPGHGAADRCSRYSPG